MAGDPLFAGQPGNQDASNPFTSEAGKVAMAPPPMTLPPLYSAVPKTTPSPDLGQDQSLLTSAGYGGGAAAGMGIADQVLRGWMAGRHVAEERQLQQRQNEVLTGTAQVNQAISTIKQIASDPTLSDDERKTQLEAAQTTAHNVLGNYYQTLQKHVDTGMKSQKGVMGKIKSGLKGVFMPDLERIPQQALDSYYQLGQQTIQQAAAGHPSLADQADLIKLQNMKTEQAAVAPKTQAEIAGAGAAVKQAGATGAQADVAVQAADLSQQMVKQIQAGPQPGETPEQRTQNIQKTAAQIAALTKGVYEDPTLTQAKAAHDIAQTQFGTKLLGQAQTAMDKLQKGQVLTTEELASVQAAGLKVQPENLFDALTQQVYTGQKPGINKAIQDYSDIMSRQAREARNPTVDESIWSVLKMSHPLNQFADQYTKQNPQRPGETTEQYTRRVNDAYGQTVADDFISRVAPTPQDKRAPVKLATADKARIIGNGINAVMSSVAQDDKDAFEPMLIHPGTPGSGNTVMIRPYDQALAAAKQQNTFGSWSWSQDQQKQFDTNYQRLQQMVTSALTNNDDLDAGQLRQILPAIMGGYYGAGQAQTGNPSAQPQSMTAPPSNEPLVRYTPDQLRGMTPAQLYQLNNGAR